VTDFEARLGIFARTFRRPTAQDVAAAVHAAGYALGHWNFAAIGLPTLADGLTEDAFLQVRAAFDDVDIAIPSVSATYNMIHPDQDFRADRTKQATHLIRHAGLLGADVVTLCTGTRNPRNMWHGHPDNTTPQAWRDLRTSLDELLSAAADANVTLGVEPEGGNVIRDASAATRLLDELGQDAPIGIVLDPANLLSPATVARQEEILTDAVDQLGPRIVGVQAKDVVEAGGYSAAGAGSMDFDLVFRLLDRVAEVPVIVQDASEDDAARVHADLIRWHAGER
jgi:sugar phosphate isomerase/epimerase